MCDFFRYALPFNKMTNGHIISKLDLCEGGSFSSAIFNSDSQLSCFSFLCFISLCPFVALLNYKGNICRKFTHNFVYSQERLCSVLYRAVTTGECCTKHQGTNDSDSLLMLDEAEVFLHGFPNLHIYGKVMQQL